MLINREAARNNIHIIFTLREILCDGGKIDAFHTVHIVKVTGNHAARNIAVLRPVKQSKAGRVVNRPPTPEEIGLYRPWLMREISIVHPKLIATLGNVPLRSLTGRTLTIGELHGKLLSENNLRIFPMYHPASMIYNPSLRDIFEEDLRVLAGIIREG